MTRPSKNTDQLLIQAARELLPETGCSGLNLRQVAAKAGVNLGMFHYHFKTKNEFTRQVLQDLYEGFLNDLTLETDTEGTPETKLRLALGALGKFSRDQRSLVIAILRDVLNGDPEVISFVKNNFGRHIGLLLSIVEECRRAGRLQDLPNPVILLILISPVVIPNLMVDVLGRIKVIHPLGLKRVALQKLILSEAALQRRIDLAIDLVSKNEYRGRKATL